MKVQEVITANHLKRYLVIDDHDEMIVSVARFLRYKDHTGSARNTLRAYAFRLKLYFGFLSQKHWEFDRVGVEDIAEFVQWLRSPRHDRNVIPVPAADHRRSSRTVNQVLDTVITFYDYVMMHQE